MTAKIGLEDVRIHAPHGFFEEEHLMGNEFSIDVEVEANITSGAQNDDLGGTVNYATIYYLIQAEMKKPTLLLEALAYRMGSRILNQFDSVSSVKLRLKKLNPPLGGKVGAAVVEVALGAGEGAGAGAVGGAGRGMPHTFEDDGEFDDDFGGGGGFSGGGFGGGGFAAGGFSGGGGLSGFPKPTPAPSPPPMTFDDDLDDEAFDDEDWDEGDFDDDIELPEGAPAFDIPEMDDDDDFDYEGMDFDDDMDFDDFDMEGFNFDDLDIPPPK